MNKGMQMVRQSMLNESPFEIEHKKEQAKYNNMYGNLDIAKIEVHGYKDRNEDMIVIVGITKDRGKKFYLNTNVERTDDQEPGDAGAELVSGITDKVLVLILQTSTKDIWGIGFKNG